MSFKLSYFLVFKLIILTFKCMGEHMRSLPPSNKGFGPYYVSTRSLEKCKSETALDIENTAIFNVGVKKISRTEEEYVGNTTFPNDVQIIKGLVQFKKWQDGGFRTEFKRNVEHPCSAIGLSIIIKKNFNPDKNCVIKKGNYKVEGLNPNYIMHLFFQSYHYERYLFILDWYTNKGSLGCFKMMCEVKPLRVKKKKID